MLIISCRDPRFRWKAQDISSSTDSPAPKDLRPFVQTTGPAERTKRAKNPLAVFELFFTVAVIDNILQQTKRYAIQQGAVEFELCREELLAFLAMNIAMGMVRLPSIRDYWCKCDIMQTPWFPTIMSRDRFFEIMRYLHLVDSSKQKPKGDQAYDPLYKVRPLISHLSGLFLKYYYPRCELAVDEMMIGTRCRISFLQYLPLKPTKWGVKVWVNSESKTGYVVRFDIYTGKQDSTVSEESDDRSATHKVVMNLMKDLTGKWHKVFMDNFYSAPALFLDLLENSTYACGTVRQTRKHFPEQLKVNKKLKQNCLKPTEYRFATTNDITAALWHDRKDIFMLTTMHNNSVTIINKRPKGSREKVDMPCPSAIADYNEFMSGVDISDQHLSYYSLTVRRMIKWWKKVFWRLLDICILNSSIILRSNYPDAVKSNKAFRLHLIELLVRPLLMLRARPDSPRSVARHDRYGRNPSQTPMRLRGKHFSYKCDKRGRCAVCASVKTPSGKKKDTKTHNHCKKCQVHLCVGECFEKYHTFVNFKR